MLATDNLSSRLSFDVQGAQSLRAKAAAGDPEALRAAAKQFEAMFVQIMLKTMRETKFSSEGDPFGDSGNLKMYQELLDQQWAQSMAAGKGLGFADAMVEAMESRARAATPEQAARLAQPSGEVVAMPLTKAGAARGSTGVPLTSPAAAAMPLPSSEQTSAAPVRRPSPNLGQTNIQATALPGARAAAGGDYRQQFIDRLSPHADQVEAETGIPARFILAHAALETGWGRHEIRTADGGNSYNLFGIKAGRGWSGAVAEQETTEYQYGIPVRKTEPFRAYASYTESLRDYVGLLAKRYQGAYQAGADANAFAQALASGGYATDPAYSSKLQQTIASVSARLDQV